MDNRFNQLLDTTINNVVLTGQMFRHAGGRDPLDHEFNIFDNPGTFFFRVFFDFAKPDGLLYLPPNNEFNGYASTDNWWDPKKHYSNCALNYLLVNGEYERATLLTKFIQLLSNISVYSPWYFVSISGLGELLKRDVYYTGTFQPVQEIKGITIKCLPDAYDTRIGTLLDMYKSIAISHKLNKWILPENLRQFDMYIYVFHNPINRPGSSDNDTRGERSFGQSNNAASYVSSKLIELHGCEFDAGANASAYETLDNTEGMHPEYTISIPVKWVQEQRLNTMVGNKIEHMIIGDMVKGDLFLDDHTEGAAGSTITESGDFKDNYDKLKEDKIAETRVQSKSESAKLGLGDNQRYRGGNGLLGGKISRAMDRIAGNIKQVGGAIASTVGSYLDPGNLINMGLDAAGDLVNRLTFGNLFYGIDSWNSLDSAASNISSKISQFSANSLVNRGTQMLSDKIHRKDGWTRSTTSSQLRQNMFDEDR